MKSRAIKFTYRNHRQEVAERRVVPEAIIWTDEGGDYGYEPGWALKGFDLDKQAVRTFFLSHIIVDRRFTLMTFSKGEVE